MTCTCIFNLCSILPLQVSAQTFVLREVVQQIIVSIAFTLRRVLSLLEKKRVN